MGHRQRGILRTKAGGIDHEGIAKCQKTGDIAEFLRKNIRQIINTRDMRNGNILVENIFTDKILTEINPFHLLGGGTLRPVDGTLIIIENWNRRIQRKIKVTEENLELYDKLGGLVQRIDFSFTTALGSSLVADTTPDNRSTRVKSEPARDGAERL